MAPTIEQRLTALEKDVNRVLEALQDIAIVDDGDEYNEVEEGGSLDIERRTRRCEEIIQALFYKAQIIKERGNG